ncbi:MOSC domain-containing protein [Agromyces kandeliae]|uniref:MOSC domain-containing protein n=1 Tax=Agromyces kandeliae TaxID=2666141 RepID=A0A6L5R339_9MICO|nr:MOSC N-terminal beta barrel domain-containing protein [Agromyces kandeliae]MRX44461.1 MOSC domain-containing protein [Agromyces kandeliae]
MQVTRLRVYPVKSFAGRDVTSAVVRPWGLESDRRWGVVEPDGTPVTARERNALLGLTAEPLADGGLLLAAPGDAEPLRVDPPYGAAPIPVGHSRQREALPAGDEADAWLTERMRMPLRLVWQPDPSQRAVNPAHGGRPGDGLTLADAGPLLLASEASLAQLNAWTPDDVPPLDVVRFRPNVVVDGDAPFAEDAWTQVRIGGVRFHFGEVCDRCVMTTIDPETLARGKEPIRTLARHRKWDGATWFGIRLVPELDRDAHGGSARMPRLAIGDDVEVAVG